MADESNEQTSNEGGQQNPLLVKFAPETPIYYVDGALSQTYTPGITKFYLYRVDGDPHAKGQGTIVPAVQIVMPAMQFAHMVTFFEHRLSVMIEKGIVPQEFVDAARASWVEGSQNVG
jgi:hypothetical protein